MKQEYKGVFANNWESGYLIVAIHAWEPEIAIEVERFSKKKRVINRVDYGKINYEKWIIYVSDKKILFDFGDFILQTEEFEEIKEELEKWKQKIFWLLEHTSYEDDPSIYSVAICFKTELINLFKNSGVKLSII